MALLDWNQKCFIVTAAPDDIPISTTAIKVQEEFFRNKALNFKMPAKGRFNSEDQAMPNLELDVHTYLPFFEEDQDALITKIGHVLGILARLDKGIAIQQ